MKNKYSYPAVFEPAEEGGYTVTFPDLPGCITEGDDEDEALRMAEEALGLYLYTLEKEDAIIPEPSNIDDVKVPDGGFVRIIDIWMPLVRERIENKAVNLTVTLPRWLKDAAEKKKVNFSQVLQAALKEYLGLHVR
ncbi:type II toxin-antitoxin system HicB family antitoxin [Thermosediminibacter litoriperuensis]|uniref:Putative RNase H-like HicB family nuclease n=1 Tax=Thermosediminibacter litoriperuensis TaxID=291989 RepID=A0A5S5APL3_9FIRM|nr:type II toxin-antitoxin system HicB family antitoxin [Thermosediminibacter litoriperuensis]TYP52476.1 putative RNase H-like HicB family nuclease [Thermosediminibacter litoriperuensis]